MLFYTTTRDPFEQPSIDVPAMPEVANPVKFDHPAGIYVRTKPRRYQNSVHHVLIEDQESRTQKANSDRECKVYMARIELCAPKKARESTKQTIPISQTSQHDTH